MAPTRKDARIAGATYLLLGVFAPFSLLYVPGKLIVAGDAAATAANIRASQMLFRLGIASDVLGSLAFILVAAALYRLLRGVDQGQASLMVIFAALSVPIALLNAANEVVALTLIRGADFLKVFPRTQLDALAMTFLNLHAHGTHINEMFWGAWLFPFGLLVIRSGFLPRILGWFLLVNGAAYCVVSLTWLLLPEYALVVNHYALYPELGELFIMLWLLIVGVKTPAVQTPAAAVATT